MSILKKLLDPNTKIYFTDSLYDFVYSDSYSYHEKVVQKALTNLNTHRKLEILEIIKFLKDYRGKEIEFSSFGTEKNISVFLFSNPYMESNKLTTIEEFPVIHSESYNNYHTRCFNPESGIETFRDYKGNIIKPALLYSNYRILYAIRQVYQESEKKYSILIYSFKNVLCKDEILLGKEDDYFSLDFKLNCGGRTDNFVQKVFLFKKDVERLIIKNLRIVDCKDYDCVDVTKISETIFSINSFYSYTLGSNNWDIDTTTFGIFNFFTNSWLEYQEYVERYKK